MDRVLRRYFWAFNLAFLALAMLLLARTANLFVESSIAPVPSAQAAQPSSGSAGSVNKRADGGRGTERCQ